MLGLAGTALPPYDSTSVTQDPLFKASPPQCSDPPGVKICLGVSLHTSSSDSTRLKCEITKLGLAVSPIHFRTNSTALKRDRKKKKERDRNNQLKLRNYVISFSSVQSLSHVWPFVTPWIAARQASLSITNSQSSPKLMSIESVMPSSHLILCRPLLCLPPIPSSIRVFSNESAVHMRLPKYWSFSFSISPSKEHPGLISFRTD